MVIDELFAKKGATLMPIDSYDNQMIHEIVYEGQSFHFAKQKDLTGTSEIVADNAVDEPIISLGVSGNTSQKTYAGYNLLNKEDFNREELRNETAIRIHAANVLSNAQVNAMFKPNTTYTISYEVECVEGIVDGASVYSTTMFMLFTLNLKNFVFAKGGIPKTGEIWHVSKDFTTPENFYEGNYGFRCYSGLYNLDGVNTTATCIFRNVQIVEGSTQKPYEPYVGGTYSPNPDYPQPIENANSEGMSVVLQGENLFNQEEIAIPTSVKVKGVTVPLRFAGSDIVTNNRTFIDKLIVDRVNNKVKYHQAFEMYEMTDKDEEAWYNSLNIGGGALYASFILQAPSPFNSIGVAKCNYATNHMVNPTSTYYFDIWYRGDGATALDLFFPNCAIIDEMLNIIASKRVEGNPFTFQYPLETPIEHDITDTDLGQSLLALATRKGTNYLEVKGNLAPSKTDLSYWRQIIPNE